MAAGISSKAKIVQEELEKLNIDCKVVELPSITRTAKEAADSIGCSVGQIVKSLIFMGAKTKQAILVVASGTNRVNEKKVSELINEPIKRATPEFVREKTGFAIGGVPPIGHKEKLNVFIDEDLLVYDEIWAAAGTHNAVFKLTPDQLKLITNGQVILVK